MGGDKSFEDSIIPFIGTEILNLPGEDYEMYEVPAETEVVMPSEVIEVESAHEEGAGVAESEEVSTSEVVEVIGAEQQSQADKDHSGPSTPVSVEDITDSSPTATTSAGPLDEDDILQYPDEPFSADSNLEFAREAVGFSPNISVARPLGIVEDSPTAQEPDKEEIIQEEHSRRLKQSLFPNNNPDKASHPVTNDYLLVQRC
jgi:hypothetical protein